MRCIMKKKMTIIALTLALLTITACTVLHLSPSGTMASITALSAFRSYDAQGHDTPTPSITMIVGVNLFEEPANGPNWFPFDPQVLYQIHVDNDGDGLDDVVFQIRFSTQNQLPPVYTGMAGFSTDSGNTATGVPPQITDFSNPGLHFRQTYTVTMVKDGVSTPVLKRDG